MQSIYMYRYINTSSDTYAYIQTEKYMVINKCVHIYMLHSETGFGFWALLLGTDEALNCRDCICPG